jgi:broad specificity phosphatase PhoE
VPATPYGNLFGAVARTPGHAIGDMSVCVARNRLRLDEPIAGRTCSAAVCWWPVAAAGRIIRVTLVYLVQHGDKQRRPGDPGLTQLGMRQATRTGHYLATLGTAELYASPSRRAQETAALIAVATGLGIRTDIRLRERLNWDCGQSIDGFLAAWAQSTCDRDLMVGGSESSRQAGARLRAFIAGLAGRPGPVVAVSHGGVTIDLLRTLLGDGAVDPQLVTGGIPPCAITAIDNQAPLLIASTAHLTEDPAS